eukprot:7515908-Alexandrium_andersonii.AAC.1
MCIRDRCLPRHAAGGAGIGGVGRIAAGACAPGGGAAVCAGAGGGLASSVCDASAAVPRHSVPVC